MRFINLTLALICLWHLPLSAEPVAEPIIAATVTSETAPIAEPEPPAPAAEGANWPSFRGLAASGVADGQQLPDHWSASDGRNIQWQSEIPGFGHSSPVVWGEQIFLTTATSTEGEPDFRPGLYGDGNPSPDRTRQHRWEVLALDRHTGEVRWRRVAHEGKPRTARHPKASHANPTPATDGRYVVAYFGSEGVHAFDVEGRHLWSRDLGVIDAGAYNAEIYQWGVASSPILWRDLVILQCDGQGEDFVIALDLATGETRWRTARDEWPSWSTPTVAESNGTVELVTNAPKFVRAYDPTSGEELWRLGPSSDITTPTPIFADGLLVVTSGRRPVKPLHVLRLGGRGDLTASDTEDPAGNDRLVWSKLRVGPYMPTPLAYRGILYTLNNDGTLGAYRLASGEELYRQRIPHGGAGFSGSPVAADGKLYLPSEDGDIFVVAAGESFELIAKNSLDQVIMTSPALANGAMYVRGRSHLFAIGAELPEAVEKPEP